MLDLNQKITKINLNLLTIIKLKKLNFTKVGHLVMSSYPELFYTNLFTNSELQEIQNSLNKQGLDFIFEMNLSENSSLKEEIIKFSFSEYQKLLYDSHLKKYDKTKIEPLMYSDSLYVVKYFFQIYRQMHPENINNFEADKQVLLNTFLKEHPGMTIADFVDLKPTIINLEILKTISTLLGLPLNCELPYSKMISRENQIFEKASVQTDIIQAYEHTVSLKDEDINYLQNKQYIKQKP